MTRKLVIWQCKQCTKLMKTRPCDVRKFCTKNCVYKYHSGPNHHAWNAVRILVCKGCGNEFGVQKGWQWGKKFCSYPCLAAWRSVNGHPTEAPVGTVTTLQDGYKVIKLENGSWAPEHRVVMERVLGRKLKSTEIVHHRDGDHGNNVPDNLQVMSRSRHMEVHAEAERLGLLLMLESKWEPSLEGMGC